MDHETAGDPVRGLKWTRRTTAKVATELCKLGSDICARTVARLLKKMGSSLRVNHKKRAGASHPNRDDQFQHIAELRERCAVDNTPVISVDTKKKELVGAFRQSRCQVDSPPFCKSSFASIECPRYARSAFTSRTVTRGRQPAGAGPLLRAGPLGDCRGRPCGKALAGQLESWPAIYYSRV